MNRLDYILQRTDDLRTRYYFTPEDTSHFFISVTTFLKRVMPTAPGLLSWMKNTPPEAQAQKLLETSHYGTFFHERAKEYADNGRSFMIQHLDEHIRQYRETADDPLTPRETAGWVDQASNDLYSLNQFFTDRNVEPVEIENTVLEDTHLATEIALAYIPKDVLVGSIIPLDAKGNDPTDKDPHLHNAMEIYLEMYGENPNLPFAGALDLVCEMDWNGNRVKAIVDYKTGRIWDDHPFQLEAYRLLWNHNFPDDPISHTFNWRPKDWKKNKKPTYQLKNQSKSVTPQEMAALYTLAEKWITTEPRYHVNYDDIVQGEGKWETIEASEYYHKEEL